MPFVRIMAAMAGLVALSLSATPATAAPRTILFVGNSFTYGANSPVRAYRPDLVTDLNHDGVGGVPALFRTFADEAGQDWRVSLETSGGKDLAWHWDTRRATIAGAWDVVILQGYSTLDAAAPGNPAAHVAAAMRLAALFHSANPRVTVDLVSTWSRADETYRPTGHWYGKPITAMAADLRAANELALRRSPDLTDQIPVGDAWSRAFAEKVADPDPYDGTSFGEVDLWSYDQYHASAAGYYLEALMIFGRIAGVDPRTLGAGEKAADALALSPVLAAALQRVAAEELAATPAHRPR